MVSIMGYVLCGGVWCVCGCVRPGQKIASRGNQGGQTAEPVNRIGHQYIKQQRIQHPPFCYISLFIHS